MNKEFESFLKISDFETDEDFEIWKKWFDSHIGHLDKNGNIDLSKHPNLMEYLRDVWG